jgi:UDP-GlcNAc:undecaprenyl-phosphate GlcNAc-1-phosphate transferase
MTEILIVCVSAIASYLLTYPTMYLAKKFQLVTDVKTRSHPAHTHTGIIPRAGGIPIYGALLIGALIFLPINKIISGILIANFLLMVVGLFDDYYDVSPYLRFGLNILISAIVVMFGLGIPYVSNPFGSVIRLDTIKFTIDLFGSHTVLIVANLLAILWLTWVMNMVNWSKGVDGQLPGFVAITALFLGLLSQRFVAHDITTQTVTYLSFIVAGAYIGFIPHNFFPQQIMPGYSAGAMAGFLLGILAILSFGKLGTAILILAIPTIDAVYVIIRRLKNKKSPFKADWGHFHHRLLEIGWGKRRIALFYWLISLFMGVSSLFLQGAEKIIAFVTIGILLIIFIIIIEQIKKGDA